MGLALLGAFLVYGTLEPGAMVARRRALEPARSWGIVTQPLGFVLFLTAAIAETKRTPFDIPEGEPEIIGYFVEYSGMRFGMFFLAEFIEIVFLGGDHDHRVLRRLAGAVPRHRRLPRRRARLAAAAPGRPRAADRRSGA